MGEKKNSAMKITPNQERFIELLIEGKSQREAYRTAYPNCKSSDKTVDETASKLFAQPKVYARYEKLRSRLVQEAEDECIVTAKDVLRELAAVAMANGSDFAQVIKQEYLTDVIDDDGETHQEIRTYKTVEVFETKNIPEERRAAIAGYEQTREGLKVKTHDKVKALELLGRYFKLFTDKTELSGKDGGDIKIALSDEVKDYAG